MTEIRTACQTLRRMLPALFANESEFARRVFLVNPTKIKAAQGLRGVVLQGQLSLKLGKKPAQVIDLGVEVTDLAWEAQAGVDVGGLRARKESEIVKTLFLVCLASLGVFNDILKQKAFQVLTNWPLQAAK